MLISREKTNDITNINTSSLYSVSNVLACIGSSIWALTFVFQIEHAYRMKKLGLPAGFVVMNALAAMFYCGFARAIRLPYAIQASSLMVVLFNILMLSQYSLYNMRLSSIKVGILAGIFTASITFFELGLFWICDPHREVMAILPAEICAVLGIVFGLASCLPVFVELFNHSIDKSSLSSNFVLCNFIGDFFCTAAIYTGHHTEFLSLASFLPDALFDILLLIIWTKDRFYAN